jgi:hypothetical protein
MPQSKNLYVADADLRVWEQAERFAEHSRQSLSKIVTTALRQYLPTDIRVVTDPVDAANALADPRTPILEFGRHSPYGVGWLLHFQAPDGSATEPHFIPDEGVVPIAEARAHLRRVGAGEPSESEMNEIIVEVGKPARAIGFVGRWLVKPDANDSATGPDAGAYWGVALTKRGRVAVFAAHRTGRHPARLDDYDDLDEAAREVPTDIIARAAAALGEEWIIWRDI